MALKRILFLCFVIATFLFCLGATPAGSIFNLQRPIKAKQWTRAAKVWTARSCVGEAGFEALDECIAIAWVYATRAKESGKDYLWIVKRYSAAIKRHSLHNRPWILQLDHTLKKPDDWPELRWGVHKHLWKKMLTRLDSWARGFVPNPVPDANHFGSKGDAQRAAFVRRWKRLETPEGFKNWFFDSRSNEKPRVPKRKRRRLNVEQMDFGIVY